MYDKNVQSTIDKQCNLNKLFFLHNFYLPATHNQKQTFPIRKMVGMSLGEVCGWPAGSMESVM